MKMTFSRKVGNRIYHFQSEGRNLHEVVMESQKLGFGDIQKCGICGKDNLVLSARVSGGYAYTEVKCLDCYASLTFGQRKDSPDTYYFRRNEQKELDWRAYQKTDQAAKPAPAPQSVPEPDLPF